VAEAPDDREPVHLPPEILRAPRAEERRPPPPPKKPCAAALVIGRQTDNELILFDEAGQTSWIVYPPRSAYAFLAARRPAPDVVVVEHHPWQPYSPPLDHPIDARAACRLHGPACVAQAAIEAAARLGYDPFR
jgi:hypothetical protein